MVKKSLKWENVLNEKRHDLPMLTDKNLRSAILISFSRGIEG